MLKNITHLLVVDDDTRIRDLLAKFLVDNGFFVSIAKDAKEARQKISSFAFDMIILDVMMPGETGIELSSSLQSKQNIPILMLTAMSEVEDRIAGLESGADDYLAKPFEPRELLLRIKNILSRTQQTHEISKTANFSDYAFDLNSLKLTKDNNDIFITSHEAKLLKKLAQNINQTVTREELSKLFDNVNERTIDVQITRLRGKLEKNPKKPQFLRTIRGKGYVLCS